MSWLKRGGIAIFAVVIFATSLIAGRASVAIADEICETGFGDGVPVILIHGLNADVGVWDSIAASLGRVDGITPVRFDYQETNKEWVTHEEIGPKLARFIDCLAQASLEGGGNGKVIVVAHSMGGLATRYAANEAIDGRRVADEIDLVIPIATPHLGSDTAKLCEWLRLMPQCQGSAPLAMRPGSDELAALPEFPDSIPVRAIAGDVTVHDKLFNADYTLDLNSDVVVGVDSATAVYGESAIDDSDVFECDGQFTRFLGVITGVQASCEHTAMLSTTYVQDSVVSIIEEYLASIAEPEFDPNDGNWWTFFDKLAIPYLDQNWGGAMSEPEHFVSMRDFSDCPEGTNAGCPGFYFTNIDTIPAEYNDPVATADEPVIAELKEWCDTKGSALWDLLETGEMDIGGKTAEFYMLDECPVSDYGWNTMWLWYVEDERVLITAQNSSGGTIDMEVMEESFRQAVWF